MTHKSIKRVIIAVRQLVRVVTDRARSWGPGSRPAAHRSWGDGCPRAPLAYPEIGPLGLWRLHHFLGPTFRRRSSLQISL